MSFLSRLLGGPADDTLAPADFVAQRAPGAPLLDVRTPAEFAAGHLDGALNVDIQAPDFDDRIASMGLPVDAPVYLYCRSGNRSGMAASKLKAAGYDGAVNIGGYEALRAAGA